MKIALKTVKAKHRCNLGPVTDFLPQDVDDNFLRRCLQGPTDKLEILWDVPAWRRVAFGEVLESLPSALVKFKEGFEVIIRDRGGIGERLVRKPFNVPLLSRKNVLHHLANSLIVIWTRTGLQSFTTLPKPIGFTDWERRKWHVEGIGGR